MRKREKDSIPVEATEQEKLKLSNFILETERITKATKELNSKLTHTISDDKTCEICFDSVTGIPVIDLTSRGGLHNSYIKLELDQMRSLIIWLKSRGIG